MALALAFTKSFPMLLGGATVTTTLVCVSLGALWIYYREKKDADNSGKCKYPRYPPTPPDRHWLFGHLLKIDSKIFGLRDHICYDVVFSAWMSRLKSKVIMFELPTIGRFIVVGDAALAKHVLQAKTKSKSNNHNDHDNHSNSNNHNNNGSTKSNINSNTHNSNSNSNSNNHCDNAFPKAPLYNFMFPLVGKKSILALEGKEWRSQRRIYNPGFSPDYLKSIVSVMAQKCDRFLAACEKEDVGRNLPTNMLTRATNLTSDIIAQVAFGEDWGNYLGTSTSTTININTTNTNDSDGDSDGDKENEIRKNGIQTLNNFRELTLIVDQNQKHLIQRCFNLHRMYRSWRLSVTLDRDMQQLVQRRLDSIRSLEENKKNGETQNQHQHPHQPTKQNDILSLTLSSFILQQRQSKDNHNSTSFSSDDMENMTSQLKTFYFAGHDTTATTISWAYWLLVQHPEKMEKARQEVRDCIGHEWANNVARNGENMQDGLTYEQLQRCQYLDSIARETLRLYPPAGTMRYATDPDSRYGKYKLGGSVVHLNLYAIQRDPDVWGPDANEFVPERFLGDEGRKLIASYSFLPFSKGSRDCIGKYFALLETKIALAALVTRYDGVALDVKNEVCTARLTFVPMNGCKVKLNHRVL